MLCLRFDAILYVLMLCHRFGMLWRIFCVSWPTFDVTAYFLMLWCDF